MGRTDFMFAQPSFLTGLARTLDIGGTLSAHSYNESDTPAAADARAMRSDWAVIGDDMREGVMSVQREDAVERDDKE